MTGTPFPTLSEPKANYIIAETVTRTPNNTDTRGAIIGCDGNNTVKPFLRIPIINRSLLISIAIQCSKNKTADFCNNTTKQLKVRDRILSTTELHEWPHIADALKFNPAVCVNKPAETEITPTAKNPSEGLLLQAIGEATAYDVELYWLEKVAKNLTSPEAKAAVQIFIDDKKLKRDENLKQIAKLKILIENNISINEYNSTVNLAARGDKISIANLKSLGLTPNMLPIAISELDKIRLSLGLDPISTFKSDKFLKEHAPNLLSPLQQKN